MGSHHAPHHPDRQIRTVFRPESRGIRDIFLQQPVAETRIAQQQRLAEIHTAGLADFLDQQIVSLFGTPGFAQHFDSAVFDADHGLDVQQSSGKGHGGRDPSALFQIFQSIQHGNQTDLFPLLKQLPCDFLGIQTFFRLFQGILDQNGTAQCDGTAVHHMNFAGIVSRGNDGALVCAGKLGRTGDADHLMTRSHRLFKSFGKNTRIGLAGGGQFVALHQHFIKHFAVDGHTVDKLPVSEADGQGDDLHLRRSFGQQICCGIHNDFY